VDTISTYVDIGNDCALVAVIQAAEGGKLQHRVRPDRERAHPGHPRRGGVEPEPVGRQLRQSGQVLHDRDPGPQQRRVRRPRAVGDVVDVERVDADQRRPALGQQRRGVPG
jgi:hypothetical protein